MAARPKRSDPFVWHEKLEEEMVATVKAFMAEHFLLIAADLAKDVILATKDYFANEIRGEVREKLSSAIAPMLKEAARAEARKYVADMYESLRGEVEQHLAAKVKEITEADIATKLSVCVGDWTSEIDRIVSTAVEMRMGGALQENWEHSAGNSAEKGL